MKIPPRQDSLVERQRRHFDRIADRYLRARDHDNNRRIKHLIWKNALERVQVEKGTRIRVLEAMCGAGEGRTILERYMSSTVDYSGFDYSESMVEKLRKAHPEWNVWREDVTRFRPDESGYDFVILIGGLHHVPDSAPEVVLQLSRGIKPGGYFVSLEPTAGNTLFRAVRDMIYRRNSIFDDQTERAFETNELSRMFTDANLEEYYRCYPGLLAYVLYYNPDAFPALNIGGTRAVDIAFALDRLIYRNFVGKFLSFATLTIWRRPETGVGS